MGTRCPCLPEDAIRIIGKAGFRQVEFGLTHELQYLEKSDNDVERLASIRSAAEEVGVEICQMHGRLFKLCGDDPEEDIAAGHRSLRRAAAMGVKWVVFHPGSARNIQSDPERLEWTRQRNLEVFRDWLRTAEEVGTGIAIENMIAGRARYFGGNVDDLIWLVDQLNSDRVGICWDTGHAQLSGIDQEVALKAIGDRLVALHIADNDGQADRHWAPGRGIVDWEAVMRGLKSIGYSGPFNLEVPGEANTTPTSLKSRKIRYLYELTELLIRELGISKPKLTA